MFNDENVVVCWCCEYFDPKFEDPIEKEKMTGGVCTEKEMECLPYAKVCEDFLLRSGLHTRRSIPSYYKHYKFNIIEKLFEK